MAVSLIGSGPTGATSDLTQTNVVNQEEFLKVLLTQLRFQDPLKPLDNQEFLAQMAQFSALEQNRQLNENVETLLSIQSATQSVGLIGRTVEVETTAETVVGEVTTLGFRNGVPVLTVKKPSGELITDVSPAQISIVR